ESIERKRRDEVIEDIGDLALAVVHPSASANGDCQVAGREIREGSTKVNLAAAGADVVAGAVVEVGKGDAGNAHVARGGRLHGFADDLSRIGNRNQVEVF